MLAMPAQSEKTSRARRTHRARGAGWFSCMIAGDSETERARLPGRRAPAPPGVGSKSLSRGFVAQVFLERALDERGPQLEDALQRAGRGPATDPPVDPDLRQILQL